MASYTSTAFSKHVTAGLTANTPDTVTLDRPYVAVEIVNDDQTNGLYVWVARGTADTIPTFTPGMDGSWYVSPGGVRIIADDPVVYGLVSKVALVSAGSISGYHVTGLGIGNS